MPNPFARARNALRTFRHDLRRPLDGTEALSRGGRWKKRFRFLLGKYGWRLLVILFVYYLVRDLILYVLLPYFAASHLFCD